MRHEGKLRLLYIHKLLKERTDEEHTLSTVQLIKILKEEYGISAHRTTIAEDIKTLQEFGYDIGIIESTQNKFYLASRQFDTAEVQMLIDAVASSKFITERESKALIKKLSTMTSTFKADEIKRNIKPESRIKSKNESVLYIVDAINAAINNSKKISFTYFRYDEHKKKVIKNDGEPYIFSPYALIWSGDFYYAVGWSDKHSDISCFRVDRFATIPDILEEKAVRKPKGFNAENYVRINHNMFGAGTVETVKLKCDGTVMNAIIDRFGYDVKTEACEDGTFIATVEVAVNSAFNGWIAGFDGLVEIVI